MDYGYICSMDHKADTPETSGAQERAFGDERLIINNSEYKLKIIAKRSEEDDWSFIFGT